MIRYQIRVTGKVQGVFYRASTKTKADQLKISGWVRNEPDGSVLLEVEGSVEQLNDMLEWCEIGSAHCRVDTVVHELIPPTKEEGFEIRH